tara:strand:- start:719 stop:1096 length:378 start_codon:yes stop_codon:yes gene_type:complete
MAKWSKSVENTICRALATGDSLVAAAQKAGVSQTTVNRNLQKNEEFRLQYARAREEQAEHYADEIITISDTAEDANLARLRIDARKWYASKLKPKKYGERIDVDANIQGEIKIVIGKPHGCNSGD